MGNGNSSEDRMERQERSGKTRIAEGFAKAVRILSVPPLMATLLTVVILASGWKVFADWTQVLIFWGCLAIVPMLAYPLCALVPKLRAKGREGQRNAAFVTSVLGYVLGMAYAFGTGNGYLIFIMGIYTISVIILLIINKLLRFRASGHGCSVVGPLAMALWFFGLPAVLPSTAVYGLILWSSRKLKRHTLREFLSGSLVCLAAMGLSFLCCRLGGAL